jgi:hypothetical protein
VVARYILIVLTVLTSLLVILMDGVVAFGLTFTAPSHHSISLILLLIVACALDLPGVILATWRPRLGVIFIACGIIGTVLYWIFFFSSNRQLPTIKVAFQVLAFISLKIVLVRLLKTCASVAQPQEGLHGRSMLQNRA